jgi:uncharacterized membrane protein YqhA
VATSSSSTSRSGPGTFSLLGVAFVVLKLTGVIGWSWWWVLLPFYAGFLVLGAILLLVVFVKIVFSVADERRRNKRRALLAQRKLNGFKH